MASTELEISIVGEEFAPARNLNAKLGKLLGVKRGEPCPRFSTDLDFTARLLKELDTHPLTAPTLSGEHVCVFHRNGVVMVTMGCKTAGQAQAVALLYLLSVSENG